MPIYEVIAITLSLSVLFFLLPIFRFLDGALNRFPLGLASQLFTGLCLLLPAAVAMLVVIKVSSSYLINSLLVVLALVICMGLGSAFDRWRLGPRAR